MTVEAKPYAWELFANDGGRYLLLAQDDIEPQGWAKSSPLFSQSDYLSALSEAAALREEIERLREALTPSADTKAAYMGEFSFREEMFDAETEAYLDVRRVVPWITIKEIMKAIADRAGSTS